MRKEPILDFKDNQQLRECLKEWQKILYLEDWVIKATLLSAQELYEKAGEEVLGRNEFVVENKASHIYICKADGDNDNRIVKFCAEQTLVHELLHCKYAWLAPPETMEGKYFDTKEHQLLEMTARSFIMARYGMTKDWFENIE